MRLKDLRSARKLARLMVKIGKTYGKPTICLITNMDQPLGYAIGNALEVREAMDTLKGNGPDDLLDVVMTLCSIMIGATKKISNKKAKDMLFEQINNGKAYNKFLEFVKAQGGKIEELKEADKVFSINSNKSGYINNIDAYKLGDIARKIGAGRLTKDDVIDYSCGIVLNKKVGDYVEKDEELARVYLNKKDISPSEIIDAFKIENELKEVPKLILDIIK